MEAIQIQRDLGYHVKASGGVAGYPRYTRQFEDPRFSHVVKMSVKSNWLGDEKSSQELKELNKRVDPFFKLKRLK